MENPFEAIDSRLRNIETLLLEIKQSFKDSGSQPESTVFLNVKQAAELLNLKVATVYGHVSRMEIPHMKRGQRLYFSKQELTTWIENGRCKTRKEIEQEAINYLAHSRRK